MLEALHFWSCWLLTKKQQAPSLLLSVVKMLRTLLYLSNHKHHGLQVLLYHPDLDPHHANLLYFASSFCNSLLLNLHQYFKWSYFSQEIVNRKFSKESAF